CGQAPSEKNDTISTAIATGLSSATPGTYVACGKIGDGGQKALDVDLFRVQVNAGHLLHIDVDAEAFGSTLDPQVRIFDANGHPVACDDEEHGLEAWIAFLDVNNDGVLNNPEGNGLPTALAKEPWALTDNQGNFQIVNLGPGTYPARLVPKAGWTQTTDNPDPIPARSGQNISSLKFGLRSNSN
ncbi:MAG TPA: hypothetical protein VFZ59_23840, partial [Verrucomicrobiae bacterium]|nr:hypothetical protein [Verrucomicrobiae bacterium]